MFDTLSNPVVLMDLYEVQRGQPLSLDFTDVVSRLKSFSYEEDQKKVGELKLVIDNPDDGFSDDERFHGRNKLIRVRWGYLTHLSPVKTCVIKHIEPTYPEDGHMSLTITAWDAVSRAFLNAHPRNWGRIQTSDIALYIADRWDLEPDVPEESLDIRKQPYIQPGKMSDLQFLKSLARRRGWECTSDGVRLYYGPDRHDDTPAFMAVYGRGQIAEFNGLPLVLTSFRPTIDQAKRPDTRKIGLNPESKKTNSHKANSDDVSSTDPTRQRLGGRAILNFEDRTIERRKIPDPEKEAGAGKVKPSADAKLEQTKKDAEAEQWKILKKASTATATFSPGSPEVTVRRILEVQGVSQAYAGKWKIVKVRHKITVSGGAVYTVSASLSRPDKGKTKGPTDASKNLNKKGAPEGDGSSASTTRTTINFESREVTRKDRV